MADDDGDDITWSSSSSTSTPSYRFKWDVFLSFRGEDTRHNFIKGLYNELVRNGVRTFRDDEGLERGEEIAPSLVEAIKDSAASIAVISERYADSKWCLEELAVILECKRLMLPVFYKVDPSDVRGQKGPFEMDFRNHETLVEAQKVLRWREAMSKAGRISGWDSRTWDESELIQSLLKKILAKLNDTPLGVAKYPVGLSSRLDILLRKLDVKANGIRVIGFHGMGGIGKTTLAKALFNKLVGHFKTRSFISNIRQNSQNAGLTHLQSKFLGDLNSSVPPMDDIASGIIHIKQAVHDKPVLLVLDDIDDANQLNALAGGRNWFHEGSRIIITTRNKEVLPENIVDEVYEVNELIFPETLQLFSYHAFGREEPSKAFMDLSKKVVKLTGGLPLALEVFGSSMFYKRRKKEWIDELEKLKKIRPGHLQDVLEISFKGLDDQVKRIFLDLACFFADRNLIRDDAIDIFKGCGFNAEVAITDLTAKSMIKIIEGNFLWMHDQIRDMGRQIVQRENDMDAGKRSRLWNQDDIMMVLKNRKGTRSIEGITLDFGKNQEVIADKLDRCKLRKFLGLESAVTFLKQQYKAYFGHSAKEDGTLLYTKYFQSMVILRLLQINHAKLDGNFKILPAELKWLQWKGCPLESLPFALISRDLAVLDLSHSSIVQLWDHRFVDWWQNTVAKKLVVLNLNNCYHLKEIPDMTGFPLEKLILERCKSLEKIHDSLGDTSTLTYLNLKYCENLLELPSDLSGLRSLEKLILSGCSNLRDLPKDLSGLGSLQELLVDGTAITKLPDSIFRLKNLEVFNLSNCHSLDILPQSIGNLNSLRELLLSGTALEKLPDSIGNLRNLEILDLRMCTSLTSIPDSMGNVTSLVELLLIRSAVKELPASIGSLSHLKVLMLGHCQSLCRLPDSIGGLSSLVRLLLDGTSLTEIPDQVGALKNLEELQLGSCELLESIPRSIGGMLSLIDLELDNLLIAELPESIGLLERLRTLKLNNCKNLQKLPSSLGRLGRLKYFYMADNVMTEIPDEIGRLSSLKELRMAKQPHSGLPQNNDRHLNQTVSAAEQEGIQPVVLPESFSGLSSLEVLDAKSWRISGKLSDDLEKLSSLQTLNLGDNDFCMLPCSLRGLSVLKNLFLPECKELKFLPPLPSSLVQLRVANCYALEYIADLSNLENLKELQLTNCKKIIDIPGLECLKSLRRLYTGGCNSCLPALKKRLSKDALRYINYLCVPGSEIPSWFVQEVPRFSRRKNRKLKAVIIGVVVSLDQQVEDNFRNKVPAIVDVQAKIIRLNDTIFTKTLYLTGVPDTNEVQLYLCRFPEFLPLAFMLKDGDKLEVTLRNRPRFNGLKLEKRGIYLVFEDEDDYDDNDEKLFDESHQSVSKKLANFFSSL